MCFAYERDIVVDRGLTVADNVLKNGHNISGLLFRTLPLFHQEMGSIPLSLEPG